MDDSIDKQILELLELVFGCSGQLGCLGGAVCQVLLLGFLGLLACRRRGGLGLLACCLAFELPLVAPELLVRIGPRH